MSREKIEAWSKNDAFKFWDTADGSESEEIFARWICQKFPSVCNKENKVMQGCKTWHRNYLLRHDDIKHKIEFNQVYHEVFLRLET